MLTRTVSLSLLLPVALAAQGLSFITPPGSEFFEGNSSSNIMLGNLGANTRVQQIDNNLVGRPLPAITYLGWRRNGTGGGSVGPKTTTLTVTMSHADFNTITSTYASNYLDTPQNVFATRAVNLPDWGTAISPAPFDARLPLDFPFIYNGTDAVLWDVQKDNDPLIAYAQDWVSSMPTTAYGDFPLPISQGCTTSNGPMLHRTALRTDGNSFEFGFRVEGAPSNAAVNMILGFSDPMLSVPGLCSDLRALPAATLGVGNADANGDVALSFPLSIPWQGGFASVPLYTQAFALDATQPGLAVSLSGGLISPAPASTTAAPIGVLRIFSTNSSTATSGSGPTASAVPTIYGL